MATLQYPIRAVAKMTGLSIEVLRSWERRYQVVTPERNNRGRIYSEADVERLRLLRTAVESGQAIGQVAELSNHELKALVTYVPAGDRFETAVANDALSAHTGWGLLLKAIQSYDHLAVNHELGRLALLLNPVELIHQVALPLMNRVGEDWANGKMSIAQEHLISAALRNLLGSLMRMYARAETPAKLLFATPSGELHELGIMAAAMLTAAGGLGHIYLGANIPASEIADVVRQKSPQVVVLGMVGAEDIKQSVRELTQITRQLPPAIPIWVGGTDSAQLSEGISATRAVWIPDFDVLAQRLRKLGASY
jgi:DNA-binding transcriptional MerR regulator/methylmalonyl-CoA mutase cobalamin-binding subunit